MRIGSIVIRCHEFDQMIKFWQEALHYIPPGTGEGRLGCLVRSREQGSKSVVPGPRFLCASPQLDSPRPLVVRSERRSRSIVALGARRYPWTYRPGADFVVLQDPDGNLFCVVQRS